MEEVKALWTKIIALKTWQKMGISVVVASLVYPILSTIVEDPKPSKPMVTYSDAKLDPFKDRPELDSPDVASWHDSSFTQWTEDSNLAWRWGTNKETSCSYSSGSCWSVMVISKTGCPSSLSGEIKIFDKSDIQIDYTNDTTSSVSPMQRVKLTFDTFNDQAQSAQIGELRCY